MTKRIALVASLILFVLTMTPAAVGRRGLAPDDLYQLQSVTDPRLSPDGKLVAFVVNGLEQALNRRITRIWMARTDGAETPWPLSASQGSRNPRWSPDGQSLAFLSSGQAPAAPSARAPGAQVYSVRLSGGGEARKLTNLEGGVEDFAWSPDGTKLACVSKVAPARPTAEDGERSDVRHYLDSYFKEDGSGYDDGARAHLFVVDVGSGGVRPLTSGQDRSIAEGPQWSPDGTRLAFLSRRTTGDTVDSTDVLVVASSGGPAATVSDTSFRVARPRWSPDGSRIAYIAAQSADAVPRIRIAPAGGGAAAVVAGDLTFMAEIVWSRAGGSIVATVPLAGEQHLLRVDPATGAHVQMTTGRRSVRSADVNGAAGLIAYVASDVAHPDELFVADASGGHERQVTRLNDALVGALDLPPVERLTYKSVDGWNVDGFLIKPVGWEAGKSYPMVLNIHGGPNGMFGFAWTPEFQVLASRGYAVFYTNPRGSSGYGEAFQRGVMNEWGGKAYEDIVRGVDAVLAKHPWIDSARLGVTGLSYGGFMTDWIVGHTDRFKAAVSMAGISDFVSVEGTRDAFYGHAKDFGGDLFEAFDAYWNTSPLKYAPRVRTPTLLLHGEADNRVPPLQSEEFFRALRHFGVTSELVLFPREPHTMRREPRHQVDVMRWTAYWFNRFLDGNQAAVRPNGR